MSAPPSLYGCSIQPAMKIQIAAVLLLSAGLATAAQLPATVPCEILIPVLDAGKTVVTAIAPDGRAYPVFRPAPAGKLVETYGQNLARALRNRCCGSIATRVT